MFRYFGVWTSTPFSSRHLGFFLIPGFTLLDWGGLVATRFPAKITSSCISFSSSEPLGLICNEPVHVTKKRREWLHLGYHTCKVLIELFYIGMPVVRTDGRAGWRTVMWLPKFLGWGWMGRLPHFLRYGTALVRANVGCFHFCLINEKPMIPITP